MAVAAKKIGGLGGTDLGDSLRQAARANDVDKIKELIAKGADVNALYVQTHETFKHESLGKPNAD